jgi:hypothetical protein
MAPIIRKKNEGILLRIFKANGGSKNETIYRGIFRIFFLKI